MKNSNEENNKNINFNQNENREEQEERNGRMDTILFFLPLVIMLLAIIIMRILYKLFY